VRAEPSSSQVALTGSHENGSQSRFHRKRIIQTFAAIITITFLLRIFYAGYLYQDDGLWFTVAEELLRGKALYRDIYFDKPPGLALVYAGLFKLFGAHILTIRLFTIAYSVAMSAMLFIFGKRFYSERTSLIAAMMFAIFSTIFTTGHVQGLNTDLLMTLPYTAGTYWLLRSCGDLFNGKVTRWQRARFAVAGGAMIGIVTQINPKGAFGLAFFALFLLLARFWQQRGDAPPLLRVWLFSLAGFVIGTLPFVIYVSANGALGVYWHDVWEWGARYASYYPASYVIVMALAQTAQYFLLNNTLLITLLFVAVTTCKRARRAAAVGTEAAAGADYKADVMFRADAVMLLWFAVSFVAMSVGGRFFGHYFFQVLPALCLIGARGIIGILAAPADEKQESHWSDGRASGTRKRQRIIIWRRGLLALLVIGFLVTAVRFHARTVQLAADWLHGTESATTRQWFHWRLNNEERQVAAKVKNLTVEPAVAADQLGIEAMRHGGPRERAPQGPSDYLFVWGYRPEIYYWSGLLPASKYLSTQPLTGVPADVHYFNRDYRTLLDERDTAAARRELAEELARVQPEYIVDELGFFNSHLAMARYNEFGELLRGYKNIGSLERFIIYHRWDIIKAYKRNRLREGEEEKGPGNEEQK
jgi:Dolichyl-phosphate-mannose-protein mannosyltransferase